MDDNIYMEPSCLSTSSETLDEGALADNGFLCVSRDVKSWRPSYMLDFSDLSIGWYLFTRTVIIPIGP